MTESTKRSVPNIQHLYVGRTDAIHIRQSGITDGRTAITRSLNEELTTIICQALELPPVTSLEVLIVPAEPIPTVIIHPSYRPNHLPENSPDRTRRNPYRSLTEQVATIAEQVLPEWLGIDIGDLHLKPLGLPAVPTARLLKPSTRRRSQSTRLEVSMRPVIEAFAGRGRPMACQLLIEQNDQTYEIVVRTADFGDHQRILTRPQRAAAIAEPPVDPLDDTTSQHLTTSLQVAAQRCRAHKADIDGLSLTSYVAAPTDETDIRLSVDDHKARQLVDGISEYGALLSGQPATQPYESLQAVEPTIAVTEADLTSVLDILPTYADTGEPVEQHRSSPQFAVIDRRRDATQTASEELLAAPSESTPELSLNPKTEILTFTQAWLAATGHPQDHSSDPDSPAIQYRGHPIDPDGGVTVVDPTATQDDPAVSTIGRLVEAANRAVRAGTHLLVVTPTKAIANKCQRHLLWPFRQLNQATTGVYSVSEPLRTDSGNPLVVPAELPDPTWAVTPDGSRLLTCGDRTISREPIATPPASHSLPQLQRQGTGVAVVDCDDTIHQEYDSLAAARADYTIVSQPIVPVQHTFPTTATVVAQTGIDLQRPQMTPTWADSLSNRPISTRTKDIQYHQAAFAQFLNRFAIKTQTNDPLTNIVPWYLAWHREQSTNVYSDPQQAHMHAPYSVKKHTVRSGTGARQPFVRRYPNYQWRLPNAARVATTPQTYP